MEKDGGGGLGGSRVQGSLCPWSWDAPPNWHRDVFANSEATRTPSFGGFMEVLLGSHS